MLVIIIPKRSWLHKHQITTAPTADPITPISSHINNRFHIISYVQHGIKSLVLFASSSSGRSPEAAGPGINQFYRKIFNN